MISTSDVTLSFGSKKLFEDVNLQFNPGNCYGVIGANGAGKSTLLKILSGEIEPTKGEVHMPKNQTLSVLKQDHFQYNEEKVLQAVIMGNQKLVDVIKQKDEIYAKPDFSEQDGIRAAELEAEFANMDGWEAESNAAILLNGLGLDESYLEKLVKELDDGQKVKVLLAQALFGTPDVLLLDEPTNHLDAKSIFWLENFLLDFDNTVIVISHDRHFLNKVCTHMADIDYRKVQLYVGNYDFWQQSSKMAMHLRSNENKKKEDKAKELEAFIRRFSANASKSKQATSRRKQLDKLTLDDIPVSTRKHPHVVFEQEREAGDVLLEVDGLCKTIDGVEVLKNVSFQLIKGDKVIFVGSNEIAKTTLLEILIGNMAADAGTFRWGVTTSQSYLPKDHNHFFESRKVNLIDWLGEYSEDKSHQFLRGFLGRMLFSGEDTSKLANVLSGGEKVRCMISRMMLKKANVLLLDGPTNHLDLESITSLNNGLMDFKGTVLFTTHDHQFADTVSNRVLEVSATGVIEHSTGYSTYLEEISQM